MRISIIVPVYKVERYLDRCIESIVNQTYRELEIILVDDGSPDRCPVLCDAWAQRDRRIRVIHKENGGLSDARNAGMRIATGDYIGFVDSDDWISETFVEKMLDCAGEDVDVVACGTQLEDEQGQTLLVRGMERYACSGVDAVERLIDGGNVFPTACDKIYRKSLIEAMPFPMGKLHEDEFWSWQVLLAARRVKSVPEPLYHYLQHKESITGSQYSLKRLDGLDAKYERMRVLTEKTALGKKAAYNFLWNCLYHLQCSLRYLQGQERQEAIAHILALRRDTPYTIRKNSMKNQLWYRSFHVFPLFTAKVRNKLNIGF